MGTAAGHSVVKHGSNRPSRSGRLSIAVVGFVLVVALVWFLPAREWTIALAQRIRGAGATGVLIFIAADELLLRVAQLVTLMRCFMPLPPARSSR